MNSLRVNPGPSAYVDLIRKCIRDKNLDTGKRLHAQIVRDGWQTDTYVANLLIQMYGHFRCIHSAYEVFSNLKFRNLFTWNIMLTAYSQNGFLHQARSIFHQAPIRDVVTWNSLLTLSAQSNRIDEARKVFDRMPARSLVSANALISAYAQAGNSRDARLFFDEMTERDNSSWNNMVNAYVHSGELASARAFFDGMPSRDEVTWSAMIQAYTQRQLMDEAESLFLRLGNPDVMSCTSMIAGYGAAGRISEAYDLFLRMKQRDTVSWNAMVQAFVENGETVKAREIFDAIPKPNLSSFNSMIAAYAQRGDVAQAEELFGRTESRNVVTWTAMMNAYGQAGQLDDARKILLTMPDPNIVSWSTLITAYAQSGESSESIQLFKLMDLDGIQPTRVTYVSVLYACADLADLRQGRLIHADVKELHMNLYNENVVGNSLIQMYGRCGKLAEAQRVFDEMPDKSSVSWNTLISANAKTGFGLEALRMFEMMALDGRSRPDEITFMSILFACSHVGFVEVGRAHFRSISIDYGIEYLVDHYVCVVDLLARAGWVEMAEQLMQTMPFEPDDVAYTTFVVACKSQGQVVKASWCAKHIVDLIPEEATGYVLLSNFNKPEVQS